MNHLARMILVTVIAVSTVAHGERHVELILDASGSMWNKLEDGRFRIVAAKDVLTDIIGSLPPDDDLNVGLRIYGATMDAQDEGSCEDTQLFVPIKGVDHDRLLETVRTTQARGATPIVLSLTKAVADLPPDGENLIILVTDGEEGCGGDLRATWAAMEAGGMQVDLRIIGIDLSEEAAATFDGIGAFVNAQTAAELAVALGNAIETEDSTVPVSAIVTRDGAPVENDAMVVFLSPIDDSRHVFVADDSGRFEAKLETGAYTAEIKDAFEDKPLQFSDLVVSTGGENIFAFELRPEVEVMLTVDPSDPVAGSSIQVRYEGAPGTNRSWITVVPSDMPDKASLGTEAATETSGTVELRTPDEPMTLEARFHLPMPRGGSRVIGRSKPFTSTKPMAEVTAPEEVGAGSEFEIPWTGPDNKNDFITIVKADAEKRAYGAVHYSAKGSPAKLVAPDEPGDYEVRYLTGQTRTPLASALVRVTGNMASVKPPLEVSAGAEFEIPWTGPGNKNDFITVVKADAEKRAYGAVHYSAKGSPAKLVAPDEPGDYEVRYLTGQTRATLASAPFKVIAVMAEVNAPETVVAGAEISVTWSGPNNKNDFLTIVAPDASNRKNGPVHYAQKGSPAVLLSPDEPGTYEVRYLMGQSREILARTLVEATAPEVSLQAPGVAVANAPIEVIWIGPDNKSDFVTIVEAGAGERDYGTVKYTSQGSPASINAPKEAGNYEIRYVTGQSRRALKSIPLTVTAP